jgi:hypothetical protein
MRITPVIALALSFAGCGGTNNQCQGAQCIADMAQQQTGDMAMPSGPKLTVNNTLAWCDVTVTVGSAAPDEFTTSGKTYAAASGTTVAIHAVPIPPFGPVRWYNVTTMSGADATYVMTNAASQSVTACCPDSALPNGGCP